MKYSAQEEQQLMNNLLDPILADDPYAFVMYAYPWGKKGTPLEKYKSPRQWQVEELQQLTKHIKENKNRMEYGDNPEMYNDAIVSGRGIGKSALLGMVSHWFMSTRIGGTIITTANTETQLKSRTWPEFKKWFLMSINAHWFDPHAMSIKPADWLKDLVEEELGISTGYYYAQAQMWSEENPDAFAGAHNPHGILVIFDEASGIPKPIWTVTEGFFTEPEPYRFHFTFSNGRRNTGAFFECFHKNREYWHNRHIDARDVEGTDPAVYEKIIKQHGEDSDEARVEVKGQFPRQGDNQFISNEVVTEAQSRELMKDPGASLILGVDIARFGNDSNVARFRQGRDARSIPAVRWKGLDNMQSAYKIAALIDEYKPDAVNIDAGNGTGVIDRLRELGYVVNEVWFGSKAEPDSAYFNRRAEMWGTMENWLRGACIDDDQRLYDDLVGPTYHFAGRDGDKKILESKEDMKKRGLASPDDGDALALTHAVRVSRKDTRTSKKGQRNQVAKDLDYDIFDS